MTYQFKKNAMLFDKAAERQRQQGENKESNGISDSCSPIPEYTATKRPKRDEIKVA